MRDISNTEYHAHPALSASGLKALAQSPAHYQASRQYREETPAMRLGSAFHCAVLEPERFDTEYASADFDRRTKSGKARAAELEASKTLLLSRDDFDAVQRMRDAIFAHRTASELLQTRGGVAESSWFATVDGVECKCRPDWLLMGDSIIVDLKSTLNANPKDFGRTVFNFGYHLQACHYLRVLQAAEVRAERFVFVACEKAAPFGVSVHILDDAAMELGYTQHNRLLDLYRHCLAVNEWPGYGDEIFVTSLPAWAYRTTEEI